MTVSGFGATFALACLGGALAELLKWYKLRESPRLPQYARRPLYWALTFLMIAAGGAVAVLYGTESHNAILVLQIGLSAPLVLRMLAESTLHEDEGGPPARDLPGYGMRPARTDTWTSIRQFLAAR
jgi:hypothetical protein